MTRQAKTSPLNEASASITSLGGAIRPHVGARVVSSSPQAVFAGKRKTLSL